MLDSRFIHRSTIDAIIDYMGAMPQCYNDGKREWSIAGVTWTAANNEDFEWMDRIIHDTMREKVLGF